MRFAYSKISVALLASSVLLPNYALAEQVDNIEQVEQTETITVTGSRIQRSSAAAPVPTTVIDANQIKQLGFNNAGDILNSLPAIAGSLGARSRTDGLSDDSAGLELPNLRGLGENRTLVLIDGRRQVGSSLGKSSVDVSSIPTQMIERVEVITGAAGAVYGADAVSGVVNFIMKKSYDGIRIDAKSGQTDRGDGEENTFSLLAGTDYANGRGNLMFSFDYTDREGVRAVDRKWSENYIGWVNSEAYFKGSGLPQQRINHDYGFLPLNNAGIVSSSGFRPYFGEQGLIALGYDPIGQLAVQTFDQDGNMVDARFNCVQPGITCEGDDAFKIQPYNMISTPTERIIASVRTNLEIDDNHLVFADFKYSATKGRNTSQGVFSDGTYGPTFVVTADNPFLEPYTPLVNAIAEAGLAQVYVNKAFDGLGNAETKNNFELWQFVAGARGQLTDSIGYEFTVQRGENDIRLEQYDNDIAKFKQAMFAVRDASGNIVCADPSGGCAPIDPFGINSASDAAREFVMDYYGVDGKLTQTVVNFAINGDLAELPAGYVQFAAGVEYRDEESSSTPDEILRPGGLTGKTYLGGRAVVDGGYDVTEVFGELLIPVVSDAAFAQDLTLETAVRYSDYSTVGGEVAYKAGIDWTINDEVRVRASHGLATRAPNVGELFRPEETQLQVVADPCSIRNINLGKNVAKRQENCASIGVPDGWASFTDGGEIAVMVSGNENLESEESTSNTIGLVYTPQAIDNFSLALDYWNIEIDNAIARPAVNEILSNCFDFEMSGNPFCDLISRGTEQDPLALKSVRNQEVNVAALSASGYDVEMNYLVDLAQGSVLFNLVGSYYDKREQLLNADSPDEIVYLAGVRRAPKARGYFNVTYNNDNWSAHLGFNYLGSSRIAFTDPDSDPVYPQNSIDSVVYTNVRGSYNFNDNLNLYFGVNNLMDKGPQANRPSIQMGTGVYDAIGRSYYLGLNYEF
ncbi:TonB-dependent receptor domain-containing protein [Thalassotalea ganghwensis]